MPLVKVSNAGKAKAQAQKKEAQKDKKKSEVMEAAAQSKEKLKKIEEEEAQEREDALNARNRHVLSGEISWKQYLKPPDTRDLQSCIDIDKYNQGVFEHNNVMLPKVNELMRQLGRPKMQIEPPLKYKPIHLAKYEEMLFNPEFRSLKGIEFLAEREKYPVRDYSIEYAAVTADKLAMEEEIKRLVEEAGEEGIDISAAAHSSHKQNCSCENRWDGVSERCKGEGIRLRWRPAKNHHFLRPKIYPEKY